MKNNLASNGWISSSPLRKETYRALKKYRDKAQAEMKKAGLLPMRARLAIDDAIRMLLGMPRAIRLKPGPVARPESKRKKAVTTS